MFNIIIGSKFSNKCKHAVKCIKMRIVPIRNKKQAMVRFLKKDVADLLAAGHEDNAFGRIDALIVEINHTSCYDMIEQFCLFIVNQLPSLQKQSECPQESVEAMSTLIFAAARFPDLPELCDLRHVFAERYGSHMDSYVNAEFVEKVQKKTFSKEKKMQLMQNIADEFSVRWDMKVFDQKSSNSTAVLKSDQPKKSLSFHTLNNEFVALKSDRPKKSLSFHTLNNEPLQVLDSTKKEEIAPEGQDKPNLVNVIRRQQVQDKPKNIYMISTNKYCHLHESMDKTKKVVADEPENVEPLEMKTAIPPYVKARKQIAAYKDDELQDGLPRTRSPKLRDEIYPTGFEKQGNYNNFHLQEPVEKTKVITDEPQSVKPLDMKTAIPPYVKARRKKFAAYKDDECQDGRRSTKVQDEIDPTGLEKQGNDNLKSWDNKLFDMVPPYTKQSGPKNQYNMEAAHGNEIFPPYNKSIGHKNRNQAEEIRGSHMKTPYTKSTENENKCCVEEKYVNYFMNEKLRTRDECLDPTGHEKQPVRAVSNHGRGTHVIPPYVKSNVKDLSAQGNLILEASDIAAHDKYNNAEDTGCKKDVAPVVNKLKSGWRNRKPTLLDPDNSAVENEQATGHNPDGQRRHKDRRSTNAYDEKYNVEKTKTRDSRRSIDDETNNEIYYGRLLSRTSSGGRKNISKQAAPLYDEYDEEEIIMDRLLIHYSKKGTARVPRDDRSRTRTPFLDEVVESNSNGGIPPGPRESVHPPERVMALPPEHVSEAEVIKAPVRAISMQPDLLSPKAGKVHPRLPDYDQLASRFAALKKT